MALRPDVLPRFNMPARGGRAVVVTAVGSRPAHMLNRASRSCEARVRVEVLQGERNAEQKRGRAASASTWRPTIV
eukprot:1876622-Prymnesium_polylepis.1